MSINWAEWEKTFRQLSITDVIISKQVDSGNRHEVYGNGHSLGWLTPDNQLWTTYGNEMCLIGVNEIEKLRKALVEHEVDMNDKEKKNTVTEAQINKMIDEASITCMTLDLKTTIVKVTLKNGWVMVESSSCVDPDNYDEKIGKEICISRIKEELWKLEGYRLQCKLYERDTINE